MSISAIAVAIVAWRGLNTWRKELKWKKEYEIAERVLSLFYEARDDLRFIRNRYLRNGEGESRKQEKGETEEEKELLDRAYVVFERYERCKKTFDELHSLRYRFEATFGKETIVPFVELNGIVNKIFWAGSTLMQKARMEYKERDTAQLKTEFQRVNSILHGKKDNTNEISAKLENIINRIEDICKPIIQK